jgi:beta-lactam-binding protein with PASTA domain
VPDVIGDTVKQATQVLEAAGFEVKVVTGPFPLNVSAYSPTGEVAAGSTVTINAVGL